MQTQYLESQSKSPGGAPRFSSAACASSTSKRPSFSRHRRKCAVCSHPQRAAIEDAFLRFRSPSILASDYDVPRRTIYRHACALGLFPRRNLRLAHSLELIMEKADRFEPTPDDIITAVDRYRKFDPDTYEKIRTSRRKLTVIQDEAALEAFLQSDPSMRKLLGDSCQGTASVVPKVARGARASAPGANLSAFQPLTSNFEPLNPNRHTSKSTSPATPSKQTAAPQSNRHKLRGVHPANSSGTSGTRSGNSGENNDHSVGTDRLSGHSNLPLFQIGPVTARFVPPNSLNLKPNSCSSTILGDLWPPNPLLRS
jgi:hypothetical protein